MQLLFPTGPIALPADKIRSFRPSGRHRRGPNGKNRGWNAAGIPQNRACAQPEAVPFRCEKSRRSGRPKQGIRPPPPHCGSRKE